jgi:hypothetical protein
MRPATSELRVMRLGTGEPLRLRNCIGCPIRCCAGTVWITQAGDSRDIFLGPGDTFTLDRPGLALISAEQGARDESTHDLGFAVIALPEIVIRSVAVS